MKLQKLYSYTRQAIDDYHMINTNDHIAVGISGGKDSLTLLYALAGLRRFYPIPFTLNAIIVDLGFSEFQDHIAPIQDLCRNLDVPLTIISTQINEIVFQHRQETNPCSLCAKLRKGALNEAALQLGCNKVAYGHHKDDMVETMMMSLVYEGTFYAFPPVTHLDNTNIDVIRPLMYIDEADIIGFRNKYQLPIFKNPCPADGFTRREYMKQLIHQINRENHGAKDRMFHAIIHGNIGDWPERSR
ncbi:MAG: ATP-binding protein [Clostridiales bacterium]|nr:ATP-binding protein [Clostridiales bacterium]